ncbi:MAG: nucleotidyltransferase family protein [Chloroflexi bacterium]|nr:nucleotidyltransferase family protein [Chloroflexota bacterium]
MLRGLSITDPTIRFLLLLLRGRHDPAAFALARAAAPSDAGGWEAVRRAIYDEGVAPLLYATVAGRKLLPPALEAELGEAYELNTVRNVGILHELDAALRGLAEAGLPVILLKGAALAEAVYGNPALRPLGDCDLLVRPAEAPRALAALAGLGYAATEPEPRPGDALRYESQLSVRKPPPIAVQIELHWSLFDAPYYQARLPLDWFWDTALPLPGTAPGSMLGWEAQALYLCGHLMLHHRGQGLMWWQDIAEILWQRGAQLDWELLLAQGRACDLALPLQRVLPVVAAEWAAPVPPGHLARLAQLHPSPAEARVFGELTAAERPVARRFWADLAAMSGWRRRWRYTWDNLFPSAGYMQQRYAIAHPRLTWLYYPYRWWLGLRSAWRRP